MAAIQGTRSDTVKEQAVTVANLDCRLFIYCGLISSDSVSMLGKL